MRWVREISAVGADPSTVAPPNWVNFVGVVLLVFVWIFFFYVLLAAYEAASLRWLIHGESGGGIMGLTLDEQTWRVYSCYWMWFAIHLGISTVSSMLLVPFMFMGLASAGASTSPDAMLGPMMVFYFLYYVVYYGLLAFFGVRFAPGAATSIARRQFAYFDAWKVTRGRFWALCGSFLVVVLIYSVVAAVVMTVGLGVLIVAAAGNFAAFGSNASPEQVATAFAALLSPQNLVVLGALYLFLIASGLIFMLLTYGINARAVIAAMEEGKIPGITMATAKTFE
jgi:hypothetical protein